VIELTEQTEFAVVFLFFFLGLITLYLIDRWMRPDDTDEEED